MSRVRYREGWELVLKKLACLGLVDVCVIDRSSSHFELLISRPIEDKLSLIMVALVSMVCGSPPIHPSSRYKMLRSALILDVTSWVARAKRAGPRGRLVAHQLPNLD